MPEKKRPVKHSPKTADGEPGVHWMVGREIDGVRVLNCEETRSDYGAGYVKIRRHVSLANGHSFWKDSLVPEVSANPEGEAEQFEKDLAASGQSLANGSGNNTAGMQSPKKGLTDAQRKAEKQARLKAEFAKKKAEEAEAKRKAEKQARLKAQKAEARRAALEKERLAAEKEKKAAETRDYVEEKRKREEKKLAEEEAKRKAEEAQRLAEAKRQAEEDAKRKAEVEAKRMAKEEARRKAEEEARRKAEKEAERLAEEEAMRLAEARRAEEEAKRLAEEEAEARRKAEEEAKRLAEEEARRLAELEARRSAEEEAKRLAEEEARRKAEEEEAKRLAEEEAKKKAKEEESRKVEKEAKKKKHKDKNHKKEEKSPKSPRPRKSKKQDALAAADEAHDAKPDMSLPPRNPETPKERWPSDEYTELTGEDEEVTIPVTFENPSSNHSEDIQKPEVEEPNSNHSADSDSVEFSEYNDQSEFNEEAHDDVPDLPPPPAKEPSLPFTSEDEDPAKTIEEIVSLLKRNLPNSDIATSDPAFSKIMGVWESRDGKAALSAPVGTLNNKKGGKKAEDVPSWKALMDRWHTISEKEGNESGKIYPPEKLEKVWAEKLDPSEPYQRPVHKKSMEEELFIEETVGSNVMFNDLTPTEIAPLVDAFERVEYDEGTVIANAGSSEDYYSIVQMGEVIFEQDNKEVGKAGPGEAFGELALLYSTARQVSVKAGAGNSTVLFQLQQKDFKNILREQVIRSEDEKLKLLKSVSLFKDLDDSDLRQLGNAMVQHRFKEGENLSSTFKEAPFCLVQQGTVVATDAKIGPGECCGEGIFDKSAETQQFDVKATSDGVAFTIDRASFEKVFGDFDRVSRKYRDKQTLSKLRAIRLAKLTDPQLDVLVRQMVETDLQAGLKLYQNNSKIKPAMYFVREGKVKIVRKNGKEEIIGPGEHFGQEYLMFTNKGGKTTVPDYVTAKYAVTVLEPTVCGMLTLDDVASVADRVNKVDMETTKYVALEDLKHHRLLGEGQFGTVWLVTDRTAAKPEPYALKIQYTDDPNRDDCAACIRREIQMMKGLQYNFIVQLINSYEVEEEMQILMLLSIAPGGELWDVVHREVEDGKWISGLEEPVAKFYAAVVADTLAFMHRHKYVYRDLKPENVLIDKDGYPVLTDFGFVKKLDGTKSGNTYTFCGTPNYLSPEIITQRGHNTPTDNWSLGVLIYELVDGQNPFWTEGMDQPTLYDLICQGMYYPMTEGKGSECVQDLIDALLEVDPSRRFGTFREKDILEHEWFDDVDMARLRAKKVKAPWVPPKISLD